MVAKTPSDDVHHSTRMEEILLERERLDQYITERFRKEVTIFFSDVCGYTQYTEKRGDIQSRTLLLKHNRIVLPLIEKNNGRVIEIIGDGIMAAFNESINAIKAAVEVQQKLQAYNDRTQKEDHIQVKIGINSGDVLVDDAAEYQSLTGDVANVAARIQSLAKKNQILLSQSVYEQVRSSNDFIIRFHGNVQVKGKTKDVPIYKIIWRDDEVVFDSEGNVRKQSEDSGTIINLDLNLEGHQLKVSVNEAQYGEKSTISRYETTSISLDDINVHCRQLVDILNKANRKGRVTRQVLIKLREIGQILHDELLTFNVKEVLRNSQANTLIIKIDDSLVHIPWELLYDGQRFLCLRFNMGRVVKTRQTVASVLHRKLEQPLAMMVLADPTGDLKGAYAEGLQIRDFMDSKPSLVNVTLRSSNATAESIKSKLRNFDLIHFAGHSDYDTSSPKNSGWRLNGGILRTDDINKMAGSAKMPAMIFANACQSARAEQWTLHPSFESKIFGLANAFLISGVKHYIGTFWEVPDEPSRRFAIEFYKHLLSNHSVGAALRKSRQSLVDLYGEETIVWASYVLYGDPTFNYMNHTQDSPSIQKTVPKNRIRPSAHDRTREEVIDFTKSRARFSINKWWILSLLIIVSAASWLVGLPWYENHKIHKIEQQALSFYFSGNIESARELSQQLRQYDINNPISCLILGNLHLGKGDTEGAQEYYQTTINSNKGSNRVKSEAMMGLARLASMEHQPQKALQLYQDAAQIDPSNVRALSSQAVILGRENREAEALSLYRKALDISPKNREIQMAAKDISERLSLQSDQAKQSRIDQLVNELIERSQRTITTVRKENQWTSKPLSVWLMGFEEMGFSVQEGQAQIVHVLVRNLLTKSHRIKVVERAVIDKLLSELKLGASPLADRQTALSIGRLMATRILLPGEIQYENGRVLVSVRAIESETGLIKASIIGTYDSSQTSVEVADDLASKITNELIVNFPLRCKVVNIDENILTLDIGQNLGLKSNLQFKGVDEDVIVQVTSVKLDQSIAKVLRGENYIKRGLRLEEKRDDSY